MPNFRIGKILSDLQSALSLEGQGGIMPRCHPPMLITVKMQHVFLTVMVFGFLN